MKNYYVRFNSVTQMVDVFSRADDSLILSVAVTDGIVPIPDVEQIAHELNISERNQIEELDWDIYFEGQCECELAEESLLEV
ncbi:MAG: hypothetical protein HFJ47_02180 [Clostridia bacterium]|nr:hypothetical protein [Clostridia bacterium]